MPVQRIAVLGGGVSSLASVFALTDQPGWQSKYDITVYQQGWRLGGKGATGRDPANGHRILEHGLHLWFGFYENAFATMRKVYGELNRPAGAPLATWREAFSPHHEFTMMQHFNGEWHAWNLELPRNTSTPGDGNPFPEPWDYVEEAFQLLYDIWYAYSPDPATRVGAMPALLASVLGSAALGSVHFVLKVAKTLLRQVKGSRTHRRSGGDGHPVLVGLIKLALKLMRLALGDSINNDLRANRVWISCDFLGTALAGVLADEVLSKGFSSIDKYNFKDWMRKHGLTQVTERSCLMQAAYDSSFALFNKTTNPDFEAGVVLRGAVRMFLMFKGSITWRFVGGCGDTVFTPLYEVLRNRGVKFEFFHEVEQIVADPTRDVVSEVRLAVQATVKGGGPYQPLIDVKGLPCWPMEPLYEQLDQGERLEAEGVNLESYWKVWEPARRRVLKQGVDFDTVICGVSFEPLKYLTPSLRRNPAWASMLDRLQTTRTQAFQFWLDRDSTQLGWQYGQSLMCCFVEPLDTWADLSVTLPTETWPAASEPKSVAYFCGAMTAGNDAIPPASDTDYPARQLAIAKKAALQYVKRDLRWVWPKAFTGSPPEVDWSRFIDLNGGQGQARFDAQFFKVNIDPSERYVLSVTGTSVYRLRVDQTGFSNFLITGDFTQNGINAGCMEAAIISGLQASRAISGHPRVIIGEGDGLI